MNANMQPILTDPPMNPYGYQINLKSSGQDHRSVFRNGPRFRNSQRFRNVPWSRMVQSDRPFDQSNGSGWNNEELEFLESIGIRSESNQNQAENNNGIVPPLANFASPFVDPDKTKKTQNQLIILIHAAKCQKRADSLDGQVVFTTFSRSNFIFSNNSVHVKFRIVKR